MSPDEPENPAKPPLPDDDAPLPDEGASVQKTGSTGPPDAVPAYEEKFGAPFEPPPPRKSPVSPTNFLVLAILMGGFATVFQNSRHSYKDAHIRAKNARARADLRTMATAVEAYWVDHKAYPPHRIELNADSTEGPLLDVTSTGSLVGIRGEVYLMETQYPDPFASTPGASFRYYADENSWILISAGPDGDYDLNPAEHYDNTTTAPRAELLWGTYDPTNGTSSDGDIWRLRQ